MSKKEEAEAVNLQHQIRNNANDLQDYLRDLDSWEKESKTRDKSLATNKPIFKPSIPPIRNTKTTISSQSKVKQGKPKKSKPSKPPTESAAKQKISSYDYGAWDRLDVDNALREMDSSSECESESSSEGERKDSREEEMREDRAEADRLEGNLLFKSGKYTDAIEHYSRALQLKPDSETILTNRAIALIRAERFASAEDDCSKAIAINSKNVKALYRRGLARFNLGNFESANNDFKSVLQIEPTNSSAKEYAEQINVKLHPELQGRFKAVSKPKHLLSKKPLVSVEIQDIGSGSETESDSEQKIAKSSSEILSEIFEAPNEEVEGVKKVDTPAKLDTKQPEIPKKLSKFSPPKPTTPVAPTTSSQVINAWKTLKDEPELFFEYFRKIPTSLYPKLLVQFLENDGLSHILKIFADFYLPKEIPYLEELQVITKIPRFNVASMFLSKEDSNRCQVLFQHLMNSDTNDKSSLVSLAQLYNVQLIYSNKTT